jgi:hypothetical protein
MELEQEISLGIRAAEVLQNETYIQAYESIKQEIMTKWQQSPARDTEGRETLYLMLGLLEKVQATMQATMENGKVASQKLEYKKSLVQRGKDALLGNW